MSLPINEYVYGGVWSVMGFYPQFTSVTSPITGLWYAYVGIIPSMGGPDPSTLPPDWILINPPPGVGIQSINALTDPNMVIQSSDGTISVTPIAPDLIDLKTAGPFPLGYASYSSSQTQVINPAYPVLAPLPLVYDTPDIAPVGIISALPSSDIEVLSAGTYKVLASVQLDRTNGGRSVIDMYLALNSNPVPNTASKLDINQNQENLMTIEWFITLAQNDKISVVLYSTDNGDRALAVSASPPVPAIPSIITTILRIA